MKRPPADIKNEGERHLATASPVLLAGRRESYFRNCLCSIRLRFRGCRSRCWLRPAESLAVCGLRTWFSATILLLLCWKVVLALNSCCFISPALHENTDRGGRDRWGISVGRRRHQFVNVALRVIAGLGRRGRTLSLLCVEDVFRVAAVVRWGAEEDWRGGRSPPT